jgi:hypothetical protein
MPVITSGKPRCAALAAAEFAYDLTDCFQVGFTMAQ